MVDDYKCNTCSNAFEYVKHYGEDFPKNPECPQCKGMDTKRVFGKRTVVIPESFKAR